MIIETYMIYCDTPACMERLEYGLRPSIKAAQHYAKQIGWKRIEGKDYCLNCVEHKKRKKVEVG